ncbi:hypothetical protein [Polyangium aurulentum]|uniref:hypothetical protein n=1 Tax=Polyangium aurulentum TaxID=2567896 RepID=UPI0010AEE020|nr:hypothetical protein [Polyangium aurulentum]UQA62405.1 hypothetical protein E8A73_018890 [Polyangium aurulentum]
MLARPIAAVLAAGLVLGPTFAHAAEPPANGGGAIVVAISDAASPAAKPLARDVYRDDALRPSLEEPAARVLAGEAPPEDASPKLREMAEIRTALPKAEGEAASRRLLASLGAEHHAVLVVAVTMEGDRPVARVLRVESARYEPLELGATIETGADGARNFQWPGATTTLRRLLAPAPAAGAAPAAGTAPAPKPAAGPLAPKPVTPKPLKRPDESGKAPWYKSGWFWGPLGAVVAVGAAVLIASKVDSSDANMVRLKGQVVP